MYILIKCLINIAAALLMKTGCSTFPWIPINQDRHKKYSASLKKTKIKKKKGVEARTAKKKDHTISLHNPLVKKKINNQRKKKNSTISLSKQQQQKK